MRKIHLLIACLCMLLLFSCEQRDKYVVFSGYAQGGTYTVKCNLKGVGVPAAEIRDSIDSILLAIDNSVSGYNKKSLLSRFNAGERIVPDKIFTDIYEFSREIWEQTGGSVDVAAAPLYDLWGFGFTSDTMPAPSEVSHVLGLCGMDRLKSSMEDAMRDGAVCGADLLVPVTRQGIQDLRLDRDALPKLNYNAVAQGYSCDLVAGYLYSIGVKDMMVDIGEIFCDGHNPSGQPWTVGIDSPFDGNDQPGASLQGVFRAVSVPCGIVTSGNYRKFYVRDGHKYSHTIDPHSGYPVGHSLLSATVIAPNAGLADGYATHCMVVGLDSAKEFIEADPTLEACLIYDDNGEMKQWLSSGFVLE